MSCLFHGLPLRGGSEPLRLQPLPVRRDVCTACGRLLLPVQRAVLRTKVLFSHLSGVWPPHESQTMTLWHTHFTPALATALHHSRFRVLSVNGLYSCSRSIPCFCHSGARWDRTVKTTPVRTEELVSPPWTVQCVSVRQASWETGTPSLDHNSNNTLMTPQDIQYVTLVECRLRLNGGAFCIYC